MHLSGFLALLRASAVLLGFAAPAAAFSGVALAAPLDELDARLERIAEDQGIVGLAYNIVEGGRVVHSAAIGRVAPSGETLTTASELRVGSISKNVTALVAVTLMAEGSLTLGTPVTEVLPDLALDNPWAEQSPLLFGHLLEHTGGLPGSGHRSYVDSDEALSPLAVVMERPLGLRWPPGRYFSYSNLGTTLAAAVMEQVTGRSFDALAAERVFQPLGMATARFDWAAQPSARPRSFNPDGSDAQFWLMAVRPAGSLSMSVEDLGRLVAFHATNGAEAGLAPPALIEGMRQPKTGLAAEQGYDLSYALGTFGFLEADRIFWGHWGRVDGFQASFGILPGTGRGFAVVTNTGNRAAFAEIRREIAAFASRGLPPAPEPPVMPVHDSDLALLAGWYRPFTDDNVKRAWMTEVVDLQRVRARDNGLSVTSGLLPLGERALIPETKRFFREADVAVSTHLFLDDGDSLVLFGDQQNSYEKLSPLAAAAHIGLFWLVASSLLLALLSAAVFALRRIFGRPLGPGGQGIVLLGAAALTLIALQGLYVLWGMLAPLSSVAELGRIGPRSLVLASLSVAWVALALAGAVRLLTTLSRSGWGLCVLSLWSMAGLLVAAMFLALQGWMPLLTWI